MVMCHCVMNVGLINNIARYSWKNFDSMKIQFQECLT